MANKNLFRSWIGRALKPADGWNDEFAPAYVFTPEHALAQYAVTGCLNSTFYASDAEQLDRVLELCEGVDPAFIGRTAVYARKVGFMKDMPALLCAVLAARDGEVLERVFPHAIDTPRVLRSFVQVVRSGVTGRKSLGTRPKRLIRQWLAIRDDETVFKASVGQSPSIADIVRMVHPRPATPSRDALYAYLVGRAFEPDALPDVVTQYEAFKRDPSEAVPDVPFQMLTSLDLSVSHWRDIAERAPWQMTRMNLNTFARHDVFADKGLTKRIAARLRDPEAIARARVMPHQLLVAYHQADAAVPGRVRDALQDAMEIAIQNVPDIGGEVVICPDVSGSMIMPATGYRRGATSIVRCVDVAALMAAAILRRNQASHVLPFEHRVVPVRLNRRDSVMTNAARLASVGGGGTSCSAPLAKLNRERRHADLIILISDNESWIDAARLPGTQTMQEWNRFKDRNPGARLACIDIQPYRTTQAYDREDILNVGGFNDAVFELIARFARGETRPDAWVEEIERIEIQ